jgi:flagellar biosynthesis anti-sigma factor FlgM
MRVDSFVSAAASNDLEVRTNQESMPSAVSTASGAPQDRTTLTSSSDSVASLTQQAMLSGAERSQTVQALQQSVSSGDYKVDASKIADAMATATY